MIIKGVFGGSVDSKGEPYTTGLVHGIATHGTTVVSGQGGAGMFPIGGGIMDSTALLEHIYTYKPIGIEVTERYSYLPRGIPIDEALGIIRDYLGFLCTQLPNASITGTCTRDIQGNKWKAKGYTIKLTDFQTYDYMVEWNDDSIDKTSSYLAIRAIGLHNNNYINPSLPADLNYIPPTIVDGVPYHIQFGATGMRTFAILDDYLVATADGDIMTKEGDTLTNSIIDFNPAVEYVLPSSDYVLLLPNFIYDEQFEGVFGRNNTYFQVDGQPYEKALVSCSQGDPNNYYLVFTNVLTGEKILTFTKYHRGRILMNMDEHVF